MTDILRPRRGSMAHRPRKRARSQNARVCWQPSNDKRVLGIAGYKAGMTHIAMVDQTESPTKGQEIVTAATVVEIPPMVVYGVRCYDDVRSLGDVLVQDEKILRTIGFRAMKKRAVPNEQEVTDVRLLAFCQPGKTGFGKKHVECMELGLGGKDAKEKLDYAKGLLGKELKASDVFKPGEKIDVVAVTRGKGWQGAVKRFGISVQRRKATNKRRHVGTLGQWHPAYVLYTVPQAGQTGYHTRTELNKEVVKISDKGEEVNPPSGFPNYGFVSNGFVVLRGSVPGPVKRLVKLRLAVRGKTGKDPQLLHISREPR